MRLITIRFSRGDEDGNISLIHAGMFVCLVCKNRKDTIVCKYAAADDELFITECLTNWSGDCSFEWRIDFQSSFLGKFIDSTQWCATTSCEFPYDFSSIFFFAAESVQYRLYRQYQLSSRLHDQPVQLGWVTSNAFQGRENCRHLPLSILKRVAVMWWMRSWIGQRATHVS